MSRPKMASFFSSHYFFLILLGICLSYFIVEIFMIPTLRLETDEFWFGHHIYEYTQGLPYRDFLPYKTVLGYYLLSAPLFFSHALLKPLFYMKDEIAFINTILMGMTAYFSMRFFNRKAILLTLAIILSTHFFLLYSVDLRVDMLTAWLGLISILWILANRPVIAGIAIGISFLISQKALWFFISSNAAFLGYWFLIERNRTIFFEIIIFNCLAGMTIAAYFLFWLQFADFNTLYNSIFYEAYTQSKITWYASNYYSFWKSNLSTGALFFLLLPLTVFCSVITKNSRKQHFFIMMYASTLFACILIYQQLFPYNMVLAVPLFFVLYADFFSWLIKIFNQPLKITLNHRMLFWIISLYVSALLAIILLFNLPNYHYFIISIPILLGLFLSSKNQSASIIPKLLYLIIIFTGIIYPLFSLSLAFSTGYNVNGRYQQNMVTMANDLLKEGGNYIAGIPFVHDKNQPIKGLRNLIAPQITYLSNPAPELLPILISSLYLTPRTSREVIDDLTHEAIKLYINNHRIMFLPTDIRQYLWMEFQHYCGSIYIYAPLVLIPNHTINIKFKGSYSLEPIHPNQNQIISIKIDGKMIQPFSHFYLTQGQHTSFANINYRLKFNPKHLVINRNKMNEIDHWESMIRY